LGRGACYVFFSYWFQLCGGTIKSWHQVEKKWIFLVFSWHPLGILLTFVNQVRQTKHKQIFPNMMGTLNGTTEKLRSIGQKTIKSEYRMSWTVLLKMFYFLNFFTTFEIYFLTHKMCPSSPNINFWWFFVLLIWASQ
jgi:hypothetical protein